jgi:hypothetical protein
MATATTVPTPTWPSRRPSNGVRMEPCYRHTCRRLPLRVSRSVTAGVTGRCVRRDGDTAPGDPSSETQWRLAAVKAAEECLMGGWADQLQGKGHGKTPSQARPSESRTPPGDSHVSSGSPTSACDAADGAASRGADHRAL